MEKAAKIQHPFVNQQPCDLADLLEIPFGHLGSKIQNIFKKWACRDSVRHRRYSRVELVPQFRELTLLLLIRVNEFALTLA